MSGKSKSEGAAPGSSGTDVQRAAADKLMMDEYGDLVSEVRRFADMTGTAAWVELYEYITDRIARHAAAVLDAEGTREVIRHQEGVKVLRELVARVREPVDELETFKRSRPLFAAQCAHVAEWVPDVGAVVLKGAKSSPQSGGRER